MILRHNFSCVVAYAIKSNLYGENYMVTYITVCVTVRVSEREAQFKETGLFPPKARKKVANVN